MSETTFYIVRHGESEANAGSRFSGRQDSPLTERGRAQSIALADALADVAFDRIVATPLSRSLDTALVIARRRMMPVDVLRDLIEIDVGERTGKAFDEVRGLPDWKDDGFVAWPGGETLEQVVERALRAIRRLHRESAGGRILLVGHGGVTRILASYYLGILPRLDGSRQTNTAVTVIVVGDDGGRVERLFGSEHVHDARF